MRLVCQAPGARSVCLSMMVFSPPSPRGGGARLVCRISLACGFLRRAIAFPHGAAERKRNDEEQAPHRPRTPGDRARPPARHVAQADRREDRQAPFDPVAGDRTASDKGAFGILSNRCFGQKPFIKDRRPTAAHNHRIFFNEYLLNHMPIWYTIICRWTFSRAENNLRRDIEKGRVYHVRKTGLRRPAHSCALFRLLSPVKSAPRPRQGPKSCPQPTFSDGLNAPPAHLLRQRRIYFVH